MSYIPEELNKPLLYINGELTEYKEMTTHSVFRQHRNYREEQEEYQDPVKRARRHVGDILSIDGNHYFSGNIYIFVDKNQEEKIIVVKNATTNIPWEIFESGTYERVMNA
jgi:hypothetical protein